jgi:hypothetical protein
MPLHPSELRYHHCRSACFGTTRLRIWGCHRQKENSISIGAWVLVDTRQVALRVPFPGWPKLPQTAIVHVMAFSWCLYFSVQKVSLQRRSGMEGRFVFCFWTPSTACLSRVWESLLILFCKSNDLVYRSRSSPGVIGFLGKLTSHPCIKLDIEAT